MKTRQDVMFRNSSNNEFDIYFARAALEEMENGPEDARRGSLPVAPPNQLLIRVEPPRRVHSCKYPSRARRKQGSVSPRNRDVSPSHPIGENGNKQSAPDQEDQQLMVTDSHLSELVPPNMDHSLLVPCQQHDFKCHSAPHSRSSSWRKSKRPSRDPNSQYDNLEKCTDSVPFEDSISSHLEQLRLLQAADCCVVRNFATSSRGLVNRGDSFKRKSFSAVSDAGSNGSGLGDDDHSASAHSTGGSTAASSVDPPVSRALIIGAHGVGKTALIQQFLTSKYMGALETSCDDDSERTVSVLVDGEETMVDVFDVPPDRDHKLYENIEAYIVVYSITDKSSFVNAKDLLEEIMCDRERHPAVIMVANKSDLVRSRQVTSEEGYELCMKHHCKYIEVSAALNHCVDDLLVGMVSQIRLHPQRVEKHKRKSIDDLDTQPGCTKGPRGLLQRLFKRKIVVSKSCDNLLVL